MPFPLPARPPRPSRRSLLAAGAAATGGAVLLSGCSGEGGGPRRPTAVPPDRRIRESAVRETLELLGRYDATLAAHPALGTRLAPLRAAVAAHALALAPAGTHPVTAPRPTGSTGPSAPASPASPPPSAAAPAAPAGSGAPAPSGSPAPTPPADPVPSDPAAAVASLAGAERRTATARTAALDGATGELARLLASVAACATVHAYLLTGTEHRA
ncbi:hypothetical protein [Streptomyces sp. NPDC093225]|uniref:hypothetical protein n=1 Tax=Streptomyces sp. NPDC093225 TaxID=3366034 RepID=UPI0038071F99